MEKLRYFKNHPKFVLFEICPLIMRKIMFLVVFEFYTLECLQIVTTRVRRMTFTSCSILRYQTFVISEIYPLVSTAKSTHNPVKVENITSLI
jgi:hypothetical protein